MDDRPGFQEGSLARAAHMSGSGSRSDEEVSGHSDGSPGGSRNPGLFSGQSVHHPPSIPDLELICCIGIGSYGEVWLARNIMGTFDAVKVVYRDHFSHRRPYEREFEGIRKYQHVSRLHESQVSLLHVGRHSEDRYYYYVMELADDVESAQNIQPDRYCPRTLQTELLRRGRLPIEECCRLGIFLSEALEHLHQNGLIHRDIKPGNIIFVHGRPKLADIGLVTEKDRTMSLVGTVGYLPPEGPGTAQGDLYSLGKVLYECCTGKGREHFPRLPTGLEHWPNEDEFLEFNEIILRACHINPRDRYASASEMKADLLLLKEGHSLRRRNSIQQKLKSARKIGLLFIAALTISVGTTLMNGRVKMSNPPTFQRVIIEGISPNINPKFPRSFDVSNTGDRIVFAEEGRLHLFSRSTGLTSTVLDDASRKKDFSRPRWSPDGRWIACIGEEMAERIVQDKPLMMGVFLVDPQRKSLKAIVPLSEQFVYQIEWHPDGQSVLYGDDDSIFQVAIDGTLLPWSNWMPAPGDYWSSLSPNGAWIAFSRSTAESLDSTLDKDIWITSADGGISHRVTRNTRVDIHPAWSADGRFLFFVSSEGGEHSESWHLRRIPVHPGTGVPGPKSEQLTFFEGDRVMYPKPLKDSTISFVLVGNSNRILVGPEDDMHDLIDGKFPLLSRDGKTVFFLGDSAERKGLYRIPVEGGKPSLLISQSEISMSTSYQCFSVSPDGRFLAVLGRDSAGAGLFITDTSTLETKRLDLGEIFSHGHEAVPCWSPAGNRMAFSAGGILYVVRHDGTALTRLAEIHAWDSICWSPDGRYIAGLGFESESDLSEANAVMIIPAEGGSLRRLTPKSEDQYKEGLEWLPSGVGLTYMYYGMGRNGDQIRMVFLDGTDTISLINQTDYWDYVGKWSPDGEMFVFRAFPNDNKGARLHRAYYEKTTRTISRIEPIPDLDVLCNWDEQGRIAVGYRFSQTLQFMIMREN